AQVIFEIVRQHPHEIAAFFRIARIARIGRRRAVYGGGVGSTANGSAFRRRPGGGHELIAHRLRRQREGQSRVKEGEEERSAPAHPRMPLSPSRESTQRRRSAIRATNPGKNAREMFAAFTTPA